MSKSRPHCSTAVDSVDGPLEPVAHSSPTHIFPRRNFDREWQVELDKIDNPPKPGMGPDIRRALLRNSWNVLGFTAILYVISQATTFAGPILLQRIVAGLQCRQGAKSVGLKPDDVSAPPT